MVIILFTSGFDFHQGKIWVSLVKTQGKLYFTLSMQDNASKKHNTKVAKPTEWHQYNRDFIFTL